MVFIGISVVGLNTFSKVEYYLQAEILDDSSLYISND